MAVLVRNSGFVASGAGPTLLSGYPYISTDSEFWVDSVTGNDSNAGTRVAPKATVFGASGAIASCTTARSNLVICLATHRETVSAYTWSKTGITLTSLGSGTSVAQFTCSDIITVSGICTRIENLYFPSASASIDRKISVGGAGFEARNCRFELGANEVTDGVLVNAVADCTFRGCTFQAVAAATGTTRVGLRVTGAAVNALIEACTFDGQSYGWSSGYAGKIESSTTDAFRARDLVLQNNSFFAIPNTGAAGYIGGNSIVDNTSGFAWVE